MAFDKYPYTNFHELNLEWFMKEFEKIFTQWDELYTTLTEWKDATTTELAEWREDVMSDITSWESELTAGLAEWKSDTEQDISDWETGVLSDLADWKDGFETLFSETFDNITQIKTDAEAARDAAADSATAAAASADSVAASADRIRANEIEINEIQNALAINYSYNIRQWVQGTISATNGSVSYANTTRCFSSGYIKGSTLTRHGVMTMTVLDGYKVGGREYREQNRSSYDHNPVSYQLGVGFATGTFELEINPDRYYAFVVGHVDDSELLLEDLPVDTILSWGYKTYTDTSLTLDSKAADAKSTGDRLTELEDELNGSPIPVAYSPAWVSGFINNKGQEQNSVQYMRTSNYYEAGINTPLQLVVEATDDIYRVQIIEYDSTMQFIRRTNWATAVTSIEAVEGNYYRFSIQSYTNQNLTSKLNDPTFLATVHINEYTPIGKLYLDVEAIKAQMNESLRVLFIGNSYSMNISRYLSKILNEIGIDNAIVGLAYKGGVTLAEQYTNRTNTSYYDYYIKFDNSLNGVQRTGLSLMDVLADDAWNVVIFQQQSDYSGVQSSFIGATFDINDFITLCRNTIPTVGLKFGIVAPWSHADGFSGSAFEEFYNSDADAQYAAIQSNIPYVANYMTQCDYLFNIGYAINLARQTDYIDSIGDELLRPDKNHLEYGIPMYLAGLVVAQEITGKIMPSNWYPTRTQDSSIGNNVPCTAFLSERARRIARSELVEI